MIYASKKSKTRNTIIPPLLHIRACMPQSIETLCAQIRHPVLQRMVRFWDAKRGELAWPLRRDLDPCEFSFALGYVSLIDVHPSAQDRPRRFFFRVDGTRQVDLFGIDCTGKFMDEVVSPAHIQGPRDSFSAAVDSGEPHYYVRSIEFHGRWLNFEFVILPLSRRGDGVDMLMTVVLPVGE